MRKKQVVMISVGHRRKKIQVKLVKSGPLIDNIIIMMMMMMMMIMMMITIITIVILLSLLFIVNKYFYCTYSLN